ncbi:unnamed protein product [Discosporangium mesarthrocarpum]
MLEEQIGETSVNNLPPVSASGTIVDSGTGVMAALMAAHEELEEEDPVRAKSVDESMQKAREAIEKERQEEAAAGGLGEDEVETPAYMIGRDELDCSLGERGAILLFLLSQSLVML